MFFLIFLDNVIKKLKELFNVIELQDVFILLFVGGFFELCILWKVIREVFIDKRIIYFEYLFFVILEGVVIYGYNLMFVKIRICKYMYGFMVVKLIK